MFQGLALSIISGICFGLLGVLAKIGYRYDIGAIELLQYRYTFAVLILLALILIKDPGLLRISRKTLAKVALLGGVISVMQSAFFFKAVEYIPASTNALIFYGYPVTVTIISVVFLKETINRKVCWSLFLVSSGCALIFYDAFMQKLHFTGLCFAVGAMLVFSVYLVLVQLLVKNEKPLKMAFYVLLFGAITFNLMEGPGPYFDLNMPRLVVGLTLGLIPTVMAITMVYKAIELIGSSYVSIFSTVEPVATIVAAYFLLNEKILALQLVGVTFIIAGIVLPNLELLRMKQMFIHRDFKEHTS